MERIKHIACWVALLLLSAVSCEREPLYQPEELQLMVSLYIPGAVMTRAETGVDPIPQEMKITSLQIWAFLSESGELISYKYFSPGLENTGMPNSSITRFGLPLSYQMFELLSSSDQSSRPKVDVYAVANAASAVSVALGETTPRSTLDQLEVTEIGGNWPLTKSVPAAGLPMSGVIKNADVTGGYPVLNISSLKLTRAVSKIRFVFCQQGIPATESSPAVIANDGCEIVKITFDGTSEGRDCRISTTERLFTTESIDLGNKGYVNLSSTIESSEEGKALIPNISLSLVEDPETLFIQELETTQQYESRLDAAIAPESQVGPIYLRETDKTISGKIYYRVAKNGDLLATRFSMKAGEVFSRNHTWIVYACFVEETMKLELKVVVLPWEWMSYSLDYTTSSVNVIKRFSVLESSPATFKKIETDEGNGFYDVKFWHTIKVDGVDQENYVDGEIIIATPVGATLHMLPVPGRTNDRTPLTDAIIVSPTSAVIYPNDTDAYGHIENCKIPIQIKCNTSKGYTDEQLEGNYIDLHFVVETTDGRFIDLGSESIDYYRFILTENWNQ